MWLWSVIKNPGAPLSAAMVVLKTKHGCKGHWQKRALPGQLAYGYAFSSAHSGEKEHVTVQMLPDGQLVLFPELCAINDEQKKAWQKQKIVAEPVIFLWKDVK